MCIGRNYADHVKELNNQRPKQPFFFLKPSSSILLPTEGPILRPRGVNLHYEVELGIVIGKTLRDIDENDTEAWMSAIESYLLTIDMTGRNVQEEAKKKGLPWSINKGFDTFLPISEFIPKEKIPDPHKCTVWLSVNDEMRQKDSTELFLFDVPRMLSDISKVMSLEDGDVVITGTPKGVGSMVHGDVVRGGIQVDGQEVREAKLEVVIEDDTDPEGFVFSET